MLEPDEWCIVYLAQVIMRMIPDWRLDSSLVHLKEIPGDPYYTLDRLLLRALQMPDAGLAAVRVCLGSYLRRVFERGRYEDMRREAPQLLPHAIEQLELTTYEKLCAEWPEMARKQHWRSQTDNSRLHLWPDRRMLSECFIIMPINKEGVPDYPGYSNTIYTELLPAAIAASECEGLTCVPASRVVTQDTISRAIVEKLCCSRLVIADVTWRNENVWYEVGIRHALCAPTILISQWQHDPPFDTKDITVERYAWQGNVDDANAQDFCSRMGVRIRCALGAPTYVPDSLMGSLIDAEMDYWHEHVRRDTAYSPSSLMMRPEHRLMETACERVLQNVFIALQKYLSDHDGCYPPGLTWRGDIDDYCSPTYGRGEYGQSWVDDLQPYVQVEGRKRWRPRCPLSFRDSGYGMNRHLAQVHHLNVRTPKAVPFCFDSSLEQDAGKDFSEPPRHQGGHMVLFCDGQIRAVNNLGLDRMKWHPE